MLKSVDIESVVFHRTQDLYPVDWDLGLAIAGPIFDFSVSYNDNDGSGSRSFGFNMIFVWERKGHSRSRDNVNATNSKDVSNSCNANNSRDDNNSGKPETEEIPGTAETLRKNSTDASNSNKTSRDLATARAPTTETPSIAGAPVTVKTPGKEGSQQQQNCQLDSCSKKNNLHFVKFMTERWDNKIFPSSFLFLLDPGSGNRRKWGFGIKHPGSATPYNINLHSAFPPHSLRHTWHAEWINVSRPTYTVPTAHILREPKRVETCGLPPIQRPKTLECRHGRPAQFIRRRRETGMICSVMEAAKNITRTGCSSRICAIPAAVFVCTRRTLITQITHGRQEQYSRVPSLWSPICMNM